MDKLNSKIARFFYRNRNKGIPNLMLLIAIGNVVVYFLRLINLENPLFYDLMVFDRDLILHGQVWRVFTFIFVYLCEQGPVWGFLSLIFYTLFGRQLEAAWGVLKFNLFYLTGILLSAVGGLTLGFFAQFSVSAYYLNLSIFLALATLAPDMQVQIFFVLPVKMKWAAWIDLAYLLFEVGHGVVRSILLYPYVGLDLSFLMPLLAIGNVVLFLWKDLSGLLPDAWQRALQKRKLNRKYPAWVRGGSAKRQPYRFKCTVCGRTDVSDPGLEFRYCSKCSGYRCYCADHINRHPHIIDGGQRDG